MKPYEFPRDLVGAGGKGGGRTATRTADTLISQDFFEVLLGISEGPIKGLLAGPKSPLENFYIGETQLVNSATGAANFPDFALTTHVGNENDPAVKFVMGGQSSNIPINVRLAAGTPVVRTTAANLRGKIDRLEFRIYFAQLVIQSDSGTEEADAKFRIEYKASNSSTWLLFDNQSETRIRGKTTSGAVKDFLVPVPLLPNADWDMRVTKISADNNGSTGTIVDLTWESVQAVDTTPRKFDNLAMVHLHGRASNQFTSIPDFAGVYEGMLVRVPTNYNPDTRTYDESVPWNGTFKLTYTNNPAWITYELCMNVRWGLARYYLTVTTDRYEFYAAAKWCDEQVAIPTGGTQPRFTFNEVFQDAKAGLEAMQYIAGSFNSVLLDDGTGTILLRTDQPRTPRQIFTPENVQDGEFGYTFTDISTRYNEVTAVFINPDLDWNEDRRLSTIANAADIAANGRIPTDFVAIGCTNVHEAVRRANYHYITANTEVTTVTFVTNRFGMTTEPLQNIYVADPLSGWSKPGRIKSIANGNVYFRDPVTFPDLGVRTMTVQTFDGLKTMQVRAPVTGVNYSVIIVSGLASYDLPDRAVYTLSDTAGMGLAKPFKVLSIEEVEGNAEVYKVTALEVNINKYPDSDAGAQSEVVKYSYELPGQPILPPELKLESGTSHILVGSDGSLTYRVFASWVRPLQANTSYYELDYRKMTDGEWTTVGPIYGDSVYISPVTDATLYAFRLFAVSPFGVRSTKSVDRINYMISGRVVSLDTVTGLTNRMTDSGWRVTWNIPTFPTFDMTELRLGLSTQTWEQLGTYSKTKADRLDFGFLGAATYRMYAKYIDTSKNSSGYAQYTEITVLNPNAPVPYGDVVFNAPTLKWDNPQTTQPIRWYYVSRGSTYAQSVILGKTPDLTFSHVENTAGTYDYWVVAEDMAGNKSQPGHVQIVVLPSIDYAMAELRSDLDEATQKLVDLGDDINQVATDAASALGTQVSRIDSVNADQATQLSTLTARSNGYVRANLLRNGGFEFGMDGWTGVTTGWVTGVGPFGQAATVNTQTSAQVMFSPRVVAAAGVTYTLSMDTKNLRSGGLLAIGLAYYNASDVEIGTRSEININGAHDFQESFEARKDRTVQGTAPANTAFIRALLYWNGTTVAGVGIRQVKLERGNAPATPYTAESSDVGAVAAIVSEASARATADSAEVTQREALAVRVGTAEADIVSERSIRSTADGKLEAKAGVRVSVSGKISGWITNNNGSQSDFIVLTDKFAVAREQDGVFTYPFIVGLVNGITTTGISGLLVVDGTIKTRALEAESVTADKIRAKSITAYQIAAGAITADLINVGMGTNLLINATLTERPPGGTPNGWTTGHNLTNVNFGTNYQGNYTLIDGVTGYIEQPNGDYNDFEFYSRNAQVGSPWIPARGGTRYEASAYLVAHRCKATVVIQFIDGNGNLVASEGATPSFIAGGNANSLNDYQRMGVFFTAPPNTNRTRILLIKGAGAGGASSSYLFWTNPYLGEATPNQTVFSPYSPSGLGTRISPDGITTPSLAALSANLGAISAGQVTITSDNVGGWGFLRSAGKWLDGNWGWVLAKHANGDMFVDFTMTGGKFQMQNVNGNQYGVIDFGGIAFDNAGVLVVRAANVINTLNVAGGAITPNAFASAANLVNQVGNSNDRSTNLVVYNYTSGGSPIVFGISAIGSLNSNGGVYNPDPGGGEGA